MSDIERREIYSLRTELASLKTQLFEYHKQFTDLSTVNELLHRENADLRLFVADQLCDCYDDYNNKRPEMCDRCRLLGRE